MSGGHFNYKQYELGHIADEIEQLIIDNDSKDSYSPSTIDEFKYARLLLLRCQIYVQRIDWLVSCDDGEDSFHRRLGHDLEELYRRLGDSEGSDVL